MPLFLFLGVLHIKKQLKLTDFPINIDTLCFKIKCELETKCFEHWETKRFNYFQTIRTVGGSTVSFRYYPWYRCLSIWIDSVPALVYGNSQVLFEKNDYVYFKEQVVSTLNNATGLIDGDGFEPDVLDFAILSRIDLNQDYYFESKENEIEFRKWLEKCKMPYAKEIEYDSGGKKTRNAMNLTFYSKYEQCSAKNNEYLDVQGPYCTRMEFQIKGAYLNKQPPICLFDLINDTNVRERYFNFLLEKLLLDGVIMNRQRLETMIKSIQREKHKSTYLNSLKVFYLDLGKYGYKEMREKCKSYYYYLQVAKNNNKVPIRLNDKVFKELNTLKENHIL